MLVLLADDDTEFGRVEISKSLSLHFVFISAFAGRLGCSCVAMRPEDMILPLIKMYFMFNYNIKTDTNIGTATIISIIEPFNRSDR